MFYTAQIRKAILIANQAHKGKLRRGPPKIPAINHPLAVGLILARVRPKNEDLIVAGILHDTVEDSPRNSKITLKALEEIFGRDVAGLVASVTQDMSDSWEKRKQESTARIYEMEADGMLLKCADMLSNLNDLYNSLDSYGQEALELFSRGFDVMMEHYDDRIEAFDTVWPENPLLPELRDVYGRLKKFL
ncbi:HD domain-containing protein [candidate division WWE3 bacterium]|nr:HD domain-containing protein [candidate division WWE3 bacterium]